MALVDTYVDPEVVDAPNAATEVQWLFDIQRSQEVPEYSIQAFEVDAQGVVIQDVSAYLVKEDNAACTWNCSANVQSDIRLTLDSSLDLTWGSAILAVYQLIRSTEYNALHGLPAEVWHRFPLDHVVLTSPGFDDLDAGDARAVTGYGKNYLLQNDLQDAFSWKAGITYATALNAIFKACGLIVSQLIEVIDYPDIWHAKVTPVPMTYPMDSGKTYLDVANEVLKASGCRPLFTRPNGRWVVQQVVNPEHLPIRWRWAASESDSVSETLLDSKVVLRHQTRYHGDVWNVPNQWVFVQQGLTFQPIEGSGMYTVDNLSVPPSDQGSVGRVVRSTQFLQASGQDDLEAQGKVIVADVLGKAEQIDLQTAPWPAARHYDVFHVVHESLPDTEARRVQVQQWVLPLWGSPMSWSTNVVASL